MKKKNLAAILERQKKKLKVLSLDIPLPPKGYVLVKMKYSGFCHTQLNEINGILGKDKYLPHCMGHEGVGKILSIGKNIQKLKIGDDVLISWIKKKTKKKFKPISFKHDGKKINTGGCNTLLNYSLVTEDRIYKLNSKNKYLRESILLGCALPTASNAIINNSFVNKKSKILIMGMGGLGYASLFVLNYLKCQDITCIDNNNNRLDILKNMKNIKFTLFNKKNMNEFLKKKQNYFDLIIDCAGSKTLIEKSFSLCKRFSGRFIMIGNTKLTEKISLNSWDFINGKTMTGAWGSDGTIMKNFNLNEKILLDQIKYIKRVLPKENFKLTEINNAIKQFKNKKIFRPIIKF